MAALKKIKDRENSWKGMGDSMRLNWYLFGTFSLPREVYFLHPMKHEWIYEKSYTSIKVLKEKNLIKIKVSYQFKSWERPIDAQIHL